MIHILADNSGGVWTHFILGGCCLVASSRVARRLARVCVFSDRASTFESKPIRAFYTEHNWFVMISPETNITGVIAGVVGEYSE